MYRSDFRGTRRLVRVFPIIIVFGLAAGGARLSAQSAPGQVVIDLRAATLNARSLQSWTLDEITDLLGRPSAVASGLAGITGAELHYHPRGMKFWFEPKEKDPSKHLWILTIYLSRRWDSGNSQWYSVFTGESKPKVDGNWKAPQLLSEFASLNPTVQTVEQSRKESEAGLRGLGVRGPDNDFVRFNLDSTRVSFAIEPNTKFAERIIIQRLDSTSK